MNDETRECEALKSTLVRERLARKQLEALVEEKTRALFEANQRLLEWNATLEARIAERTAELEAQKTDLRKAKDEAEGAARVKAEFLSKVSHELRTPLHAIIGFTTLLKDEPKDPDAPAHLESIAASADTLLNTINDVLDLQRMESGSYTVNPVPFGLKNFTETLNRVWTLRFRQKTLSFSLELDPLLPDMVLGDPVKLEQILNNFLSNAFRFTDRGSVKLEIRRCGGPGDRIRFNVSDTGIGIPEAKRNRLFEAFSQVHDPDLRPAGGSGLGLMISRTLAGLLGGSVGMVPAIGGGSVFFAEIPLPPAMPSATTSSESAKAANRFDGKRILVVDDMEINVRMLVHLLQRHGFKTETASNGSEAVQKVAGAPFDAVLMDLQMPDMDGEEATRQLRLAGHSVPVIALTADAFPATRDRVLLSGMNDFLAKPVSINTLLEKLGLYVG